MSHHNPFISFGQAVASLVPINSTHSIMFDGINDSMNLVDASKHLQYTDAEFDSHGLTVNMWIKFDAIVGSEPLFCIGRNHNKYYGYGFQIGNNLKAQIHKYGLNQGVAGQGSNNRLTRQTTTTLTTGQWYMLTFVMADSSRTDWRMYFDGVEQGASNSGNANVTLTYNNTTNALVGRSGRTGSERYHSGNISSLAIWENALDSTQIFSLYNSGDGLDPLVASSYEQNGGNDASGDLRSFLRLDNTLTDEQGNHAGSLTGATFETDVP